MPCPALSAAAVKSDKCIFCAGARRVGAAAVPQPDAGGDVGLSPGSSGRWKRVVLIYFEPLGVCQTLNPAEPCSSVCVCLRSGPGLKGTLFGGRR